jgi:hypothetical protein
MIFFIHALSKKVKKIFSYTVPKAMDDFIVNNEMQKAFIQWNETFHSIGWMLFLFIINNEIIHCFWDSVSNNTNKSISHFRETIPLN